MAEKRTFLSPNAWNALAAKFDAIANGKPGTGPGVPLHLRCFDHLYLVAQAAELFQDFAKAGRLPPGWPKGLNLADTNAPHVQRYLAMSRGGCEAALMFRPSLIPGLAVASVPIVPMLGTNRLRSLPTGILVWRLGVMKWLIENDQFRNWFDDNAWMIEVTPGKISTREPIVLFPDTHAASLAGVEACACRLLADILSVERATALTSPAMTWQQVQGLLLSMREKGEPYTSVRTLATRHGCSEGTIHKAINKSDSLKGWRARHAKTKSPSARSLSDKDFDSEQERREGKPAEYTPKDDIDKAMAELAKQVTTPEVRQWLNDLTPEQQKSLAQTYHDKHYDERPADRNKKHTKLLSRKV